MWPQEVFKAFPEVPCRTCEGREDVQLRMRTQMKGSFNLPSDRNEFDPKQIATTIGMKEPPPTEELLKKGLSFYWETKNVNYLCILWCKVGPLF